MRTRSDRPTSARLRAAAKLAAAGVLVSLGVADPALARPGTPDQVASWSPARGVVIVQWRNTANEHGVVYDIEGRYDPSVANFNAGPIPMRGAVSYRFNNLHAGNHCFRIWSRVGAQGLRSEEPSAFSCTVVNETGPGTPASLAQVCNEPVCGSLGTIVLDRH